MGKLSYWPNKPGHACKTIELCPASENTTRTPRSSPPLQLVLKLKVLKRQMDESEEEIERLENGRKKLQRDLDEQTEANDQLQGQVNALRKELR